jgi:hypothetical protein
MGTTRGKLETWGLPPADGTKRCRSGRLITFSSYGSHSPPCRRPVAWDQFRNNPEPTVMKWGFVLVTLYMGPIGLLLYVLADKEPRTGEHESFIKPLWKQGVGSCTARGSGQLLESKASVGFTVEARCAGISAAPSAAKERTNVAAAIVAGSVGFTSYSCDSTSRPSAQTHGIANRPPHRDNLVSGSAV